MVVLEGIKVCKYFGGLKAVNEVDLTVHENEIYGVIGPNGAGKTTFFNVCTGNFPPTSGDVIFYGENISKLTPNEIAKKGMARTFQNIKLFNNMTVLDNVKIGFHMHTKTNMIDALLRTKRFRKDEEYTINKGKELLKRVGLDKYESVKAGNLAYGIQRRVEIARALAMEPKILLLDEPAAGMNPNETKELLQFVKKLKEDGLTVVVIEHDMKFIMNLCDRVMVLNYGKRICEGTPDEVKNDQQVIEAYFGKEINLKIGE